MKPTLPPIKIIMADVEQRIRERAEHAQLYPLDPCPFCGAPAQHARAFAPPFAPPQHYGECTDLVECGISGPTRSSPQAAALAWNTRAPVVEVIHG